MSQPPERPNRGTIHAGCVAATQASAKALSDFCPIPVGVPSEAPGSAGGKRRGGAVDETTFVMVRTESAAGRSPRAGRRECSRQCGGPILSDRPASWSWASTHPSGERSLGGDVGALDGMRRLWSIPGMGPGGPAPSCVGSALGWRPADGRPRHDTLHRAGSRLAS